MPLYVLILLGLGGGLLYLSGVVSRLRAQLDSVERKVDVLSSKLENIADRAPDLGTEPSSLDTPETYSDPQSDLPFEISVAPVPQNQVSTVQHPIASQMVAKITGQNAKIQSHTPEVGSGEAPPILAFSPSVSEPTPAARPTRPAPLVASSAFNWEQFLGAKLFAWVGGLALFLGIAFFVKYSFDRDLIPPWLRVVMGFAVGFGLVAGGIFTRKKQYLVTAQTLIATGIVILYSVSFIARSFYHLINTPTLFLLMSGITISAFSLAIKMDAKVVAVLGMLGGFLTPQLVGISRDEPWALLGYIFVLNCGLLAVARHCNWRSLIPLAASATVLTEAFWVLTALRIENLTGTLVMIAAITALFIANARLNPDKGDRQFESLFAGGLQAILVLGTAWILHLHTEFRLHPSVFLGTVFYGNAALLVLYAMTLNAIPLVVAVAFSGALLAAWIASVPPLLAACIAAIIYGGLNALLPAWIARLRKDVQFWPGVASVVGLGFMLLVLFRQSDSGWVFWPAVLLLNGIILGVAFILGLFWLVLAGTLGTALLSMVWIGQLESDASAVLPLAVIGTFAVLYFFFGQILARRDGRPDTMYFPALPAAMPYLLLALIITKLPVASPSLVFGFAMLMNALLVFAAPRTSSVFALIGLAGSLFVEFAWFARGLAELHPATTLSWYLAFALVFTFYPLLRKTGEKFEWLPWYASALAGPLHFFLLYATAKELWPNISVQGLVPAVLGLPALAMLLLTRQTAESVEQSNRFTALYGASLLFFITLVFPIQFDRQWLTIGWALEGAALIWLNRRAPAKWLVPLGAALLVVAFVRLAFNLSVLQYHPRSEVPIFNWFLYTYGIVAAALFTAARLVTGIENLPRAKGAFNGMATLLLFLLMNIEIADLFSNGQFIRFEFSGNFARDMTYSIAWSLFALALILIGALKDVAPIRYAGLALMGATLIKLFFHDLTRLDALFRIGAFVGVAIILIIASWMYQKYISTFRNSQTPDAPN